MKLSEVLDSKNNLTMFHYAKDEVLPLPQLKERVNNALKTQNINEALQFGAQAAVLYGAAGLLLHHQAAMAELVSNLKNEPFGAESDGLNALAKFYLCKHIFNENDEEKQRVIDTFPDKPIAENAYWEQLETELVELMKFGDEQKAYAASTAAGLAEFYQTTPQLK